MNKIIVVEDTPDIAMYEKLSLEFEGFSVDVFDNPLDVMDPSVWEGCSCGVVDLMMAPITGVVLLRWMIRWVPEVRRVIATAMPEAQLSEASNLAHRAIFKPFKPQDLIRAVTD